MHPLLPSARTAGRGLRVVARAALVIAALGCDVAPRSGSSAGLGIGGVAVAPLVGAGGDRAAPAVLAGLVDLSLRLSRVVLLGSRDPAAESCVRPVLTGSIADHVPPDMGDLDGGPGTKLSTLLVVGRNEVATAAADLAWHQTRLRTFLANELAANAPAREAAEALHGAARALAARAAAAGSFPEAVAETGWTDDTTWPGYCLCRIDDAVRARDLDALTRWSGELEGAAWWLLDLHRWLDVLAANHLAALDFQRECPEPYRRADRDGGRYDILATPSYLPAGMLTQHGRGNFLELERQAEQIFTMPADRVAELRRDRHLTAESRLVPPEGRDVFVTYAAALTASNRRTLVEAARTPYESCFLVNMLFRARTAEFVDRQCEVLRRFDRLTPAGTVEQLMGVLFYRGHSFAALEWADRYQPELLEDAAALDGTPAAAFFAACRRAHDAFTRTGRYGVTLSLRDSLAKGMFDCVRATDLALTLFRNSGRAGVGHVRWAAGVEGHSVAAFWGDDARRVLVCDPLGPGDAPAAWPDVYFHGATWPQIIRANPKPYTAELHARGLDNYVWAAGYVIRGAKAGTLVTAAVPYLAEFQEPGTRRIFEGPYPDY